MGGCGLVQSSSPFAAAFGAAGQEGAGAAALCSQRDQQGCSGMPQRCAGLLRALRCVPPLQRLVGPLVNCGRAGTEAWEGKARGSCLQQAVNRDISQHVDNWLWAGCSKDVATGAGARCPGQRQCPAVCMVGLCLGSPALASAAGEALLVGSMFHLQIGAGCPCGTDRSTETWGSALGTPQVRLRPQAECCHGAGGAPGAAAAAVVNPSVSI